MKRWPLLLVVLILLCGVTGQTAWDDVEADSLPDDIATPVNVVILTVAGASVGCIGVAALVQVVLTGSTQMQLLLAFLQLVAVVGAGISAWTITHAAEREGAEGHVNRLLITSGRHVSLKLADSLANGVLLCEAAVSQVRRSQERYPDLLHALSGVSLPVLSSVGAVHAAYVGMEDGSFIGVFDPRGSVFEAQLTSVPCVEAAAGCERDASFRCNAADDGRLGNECSARACGQPASGGCDYCAITADGVPAGDQCGGWRPGHLHVFDVDRDPQKWDIPWAGTGPTFGMCSPAPAVPASSPYVQGYYPNGTKGRVWTRGNGTGCFLPYDPRVRPWYQRMDRLLWSAPYRFATGGHTGLTVFQAVPDRDFVVPQDRPSPRAPDGEFVGVAGVDFTLGWLSSFLSGSRPTKGSKLSVAHVESGLIIATSGEQQDSFSGSRCCLNSAAGYAEFVQVQQRFGSLAAAAERRAVLHSGADALYSGPVTAAGGLTLLLVIKTPHSDLTGDAERATTLALVVIVACSLCSALLLWLLVFWIQRPIGEIAQQMGEVALMRTSSAGAGISPGITVEIRSMVKHFGIMVHRLDELRDFMPQPLLTFCDALKLDDVGTDNGSEMQSSVVSPFSLQRGLRSVNRTESHNSGSSKVDSLRMSSPTSVSKAGSWLEFGLGVAKRNVSVVVTNVAGWQQLVLQSTSDDMVAAHELYCTRVLDSVRATKGVIDTTFGDRSILTFNSSPRKQVLPADAALRCGYLATRTLELPKHPLVINAGGSRGRAWCGGFGCAGARKMTSAGGAASIAAVCERLAARWSRRFIIDSVLEQDALVYQTRVLRSLVYEKRGSEQPTYVYEVLEERQLQEQEWMYQLMEAQAGPYVRYNAVLIKFMEGDPADLEAYVQSSGAADVQYLRVALARGQPDPLEFDDCGGAGTMPIEVCAQGYRFRRESSLVVQDAE